MQQTDQEYQKLLTEVIKKQIIILGPAITLVKARNVKGLTVTEDGTVTAISGNPQELTQQLIDQFMELSGLIVKKTMEPILANYPGLVPSIQAATTIPQIPKASTITPPATTLKENTSTSTPPPLPGPVTNVNQTNPENIGQKIQS
jgi:hypothetical protein